VPADKTRAVIRRLRDLAEQERERGSLDGDRMSAALHQATASAYDRWAGELEKVAAKVDEVDRTDGRVRQLMTELGLAESDAPDRISRPPGPAGQSSPSSDQE
jgi:hypothetical protein